jgi:outer membrane protein assembly factor BamB
MQRIVMALCLMSASLTATGELRAENWPGWRGPRGDGTSLEEGVPTRWSSDDNIAWKTAVPYLGHASPVVWGDLVILVGTDLASHDRMLMAFNRAEGRPVWKQAVVQSPLEDKHPLNSFASSTPATDGELVYVSFLDRGQMLVAAYDFEGNQRWQVRPESFRADTAIAARR